VARPPRARHPVPGGQLGHRVQQGDRLEQGDAAVGGEDGSEGSSGFDEGLAENLDFMDWLEERLERLQKFTKIIVKCAPHSPVWVWASHCFARAAAHGRPFPTQFLSGRHICRARAAMQRL
jgi:hypothetical protein